FLLCSSDRSDYFKQQTDRRPRNLYARLRSRSLPLPRVPAALMKDGVILQLGSPDPSPVLSEARSHFQMSLLENEFPMDPDLCYLNHAAVAPWPRRAARAVRDFAQENVTEGARHYPRWLNGERQLRERLARLINAPSGMDIALLKNTSEALSFVALGLPWEAGDEVVITSDEFPSNRIVWESLQERGVKVVEADLHRGR